MTIITLIGPRSVGKSSIGKILAKNVSYDYLDFDAYMERQLKNKGGITGYTKKYDWDKYRSEQNKYLKPLIRSFHKKNLILDLGGGVINPETKAGIENGELLKKNSIIILLLPNQNTEDSIGLLFGRERKREHFKEWSDKDLLKRVREDFLNRLALMKKFANQIIYCKNETPKKIADKIIISLQDLI